MHLFLEGVLKYCTRIFINGFLEKHKAKIDKLVEQIFGKLRSSEKKHMPRTCFIKGMTNLTMITADEEVGMALTLLILSQTDKGQIIFEERLGTDDGCQLILDELMGQSEEDNNSHDLSNANEANDNLIGPSDTESMASSYATIQTIPEVGHIACSHERFVQLMESLLSFWSWYKSEERIPWNPSSKEKVLCSIRKMIRLVKLVLPREDGNK
jgi:hypothetical protein